MTSILTVFLALQLQVPAPVGFVNDFADVIDEATERQMLAVIEEVRTKSSGEIVVVTLRDLGGRASIDVARDIGREWRVGARGGPGDPARNAAVIVLLMPGERPGDGRAELAIATGTGAEGFITDALAGRIRDVIGEAAVRSGSYAQGLAVGVSLLAERYAREFGFELTGAAPAGRPPQDSETPRWARAFGMLLTLGVLFAFVALSAGMRHSHGRRGYRRYYRRGPGGLGWLLLGTLLSGGRRGGGWRSGGGWGGGGGGGFGGFGGGGGFSGGGASGRF